MAEVVFFGSDKARYLDDVLYEGKGVLAKPLTEVSLENLDPSLAESRISKKETWSAYGLVCVLYRDELRMYAPQSGADSNKILKLQEMVGGTRGITLRGLERILKTRQNSGQTGSVLIIAEQDYKDEVDKILGNLGN